MSQTRNQRRRQRAAERILTAVAVVAALVLTAMMLKQCHDIEVLQKQVNEYSGQVVKAESFLPDGFSAQSAAYQAAMQRYEIEQGHILPEENEKTAPEAVTSEAGRCKGAS